VKSRENLPDFLGVAFSPDGKEMMTALEVPSRFLRAKSLRRN
jgi:hypothetical protein